MPIYLDYAAASPLDPTVLEAMTPYFSEKFYNPSALYLNALEVHRDLETARGQVAHWLGVRPSEIIFTAGGTEANNLAIAGVMRQYSEANMIISSIEHDSVYEPAQQFNCKTVAVNKEGLLNLASLEQAIDDKTALISIVYVNNEIGTVQSIKQIATIVEKVRNYRKKTHNTLPLLLHIDACQAGNYLSLQAHQLGVDMMSLNGGKLYGPKQSGCLFVKAGIKLQPVITGGGQEWGIRSGTENVAQCIGFAKALDVTQSRRAEESRRLQELQKLFARLIEESFPEAIINGSLKHRIPNNVHVTFPGADNERLMIALDERGVLCATGSACSASKTMPSRVLLAIGLDESAIRSSLRFSMGRGTKEEDIHSTVSALKTLLN